MAAVMTLQAVQLNAFVSTSLVAQLSDVRLLHLHTHGVHMAPGKSWNFFCKIFSPGNSWNLPGRDSIHVRTPPVFVICSYGDKTFFFTTCDSDEHCSMDATVTLLYVE